MDININDITIGQAREIAAMVSGLTGSASNDADKPTLGSDMIGKTVIVRTYSAGVHCGTLSQKAGNEVILTNTRRMWRWWAGESISLSGVAVHGIKRDKSKIAPAVSEIWLEAIEIIPIDGEAARSIMEAPNASTE